MKKVRKAGNSEKNMAEKATGHNIEACDSCSQNKSLLIVILRVQKGAAHTKSTLAGGEGSGDRRLKKFSETRKTDDKTTTSAAGVVTKDFEKVCVALCSSFELSDPDGWLNQVDNVVETY